MVWKLVADVGNDQRCLGWKRAAAILWLQLYVGCTLAVLPEPQIITDVITGSISNTPVSWRVVMPITPFNTLRRSRPRKSGAVRFTDTKNYLTYLSTSLASGAKDASYPRLAGHEYAS